MPRLSREDKALRRIWRFRLSRRPLFAHRRQMLHIREGIRWACGRRA